jgi:hypothetical protein
VGNNGGGVEVRKMPVEVIALDSKLVPSHISSSSFCG